MPVKDFASWQSSDLELPLRGGTYVVPPPSVKRAADILACVVRAEHNLLLVDGPYPPELQSALARLDKIPLGHISLTERVYQQMVDDEVPQADIDRAAYYAMFFWARGEERADKIADFLWNPNRGQDEGGESPGEAPRR